MPDIASIGHGSVGPLDRSSSAHGRRELDLQAAYDTRKASSDRPGDRVELSTHARFLSQLRDLPSGRLDRVEQVRDAIARGEYETEERLNVAIERLLDDLIGA